MLIGEKGCEHFRIPFSVAAVASTGDADVASKVTAIYYSNPLTTSDIRSMFI
jgi:hypothetical protein